METEKTVEVVEGFETDDEGGLVLPAGMKKPPEAVAAEYRLPTGHVVVLWEVSPAEERMIHKRAKGDEYDFANHYLRQSIRVIDGEPVDWKEGKGDAAVNRLFREIGLKGRSLLNEAYRRQCLATQEETESFFGSVKTGV